jgi:hypothetical protein
MGILMSRRIAVVHLSEPHDGQTEAVFASPDGDSYIGVNRAPESDEDWQAVGQLIAGTDTFKPMTWAARGIRHLAMRSGDTVEWRDVD